MGATAGDGVGKVGGNEKENGKGKRKNEKGKMKRKKGEANFTKIVLQTI